MTTLEFFPESSKLAEHEQAYSVVIEFLEWAESQGFVFAQQSDSPSGTLRLSLSPRSSQMWAEAFLGIDPRALARERREMLRVIAERQAST